MTGQISIADFNTQDEMVRYRDMLLEQVEHMNRLIDAHYQDEG